MDIEITPRALSGSVNSVPSKSYFHRALICSALSDERVKINYSGVISEDIQATINCLEAIGASIIIDKTSIIVEPIRHMPNDNAPIQINCEESGATLRFLIPVLTALGGDFQASVKEGLANRPIEELAFQLNQHGGQIKPKYPMRIKGKLRGGIYALSGNVSSQYVSGLLFSLPMLEDDSEIKLISPIKSYGYVMLTIEVLSYFGVKIAYNKDRFFIRGNQKYKSPGEIDIEGDWSNSAFWLCAGALSNRRVKCVGLNDRSLQPDVKIIEILRAVGCRIIKNSDAYSCECGELIKAADIDMSGVPDLVPLMSVLLSLAKGKSVIRNISALRFKESDRIDALLDNINSIGGRICYEKDSLFIEGVDRFYGGRVMGYNDHRIVMAMALASIYCKDKLVISDAEATRKSYPSFFADFKKLGGVADVVGSR